MEGATAQIEAGVRALLAHGCSATDVSRRCQEILGYLARQLAPVPAVKSAKRAGPAQFGRLDMLDEATLVFIAVHFASTRAVVALEATCRHFRGLAELACRSQKLVHQWAPRGGAVPRPPQSWGQVLWRARDLPRHTARRLATQDLEFTWQALSRRGRTSIRQVAENLE